MIYFAYGSNMCSEVMLDRCAGAELLGPAHLQDHQLVFNLPSTRWGGSAANVEPTASETTWGVLWDVPRADLQRLDEVERRYDRYEIMVDNGRPVGATTYRVKPEFVSTPGPPTPEYLDRMIGGARRHGLPEGYIEMLLGQLDRGL